jgi:hypothetical protein
MEETVEYREALMKSANYMFAKPAKLILRLVGAFLMDEHTPHVAK